MVRVLLVDDEQAGREDLERALAGEGYDIVAPGGHDEVYRALATSSFDLIVTDVKLDDEGFGGSETGGIELIEAAKRQNKLIPVIAITGRPDLIYSWGSKGDSAAAAVSVGVAAMLMGAFDFIERGVPGIKFRELLRRKVRLAIECRRVRDREGNHTWDWSGRGECR